MMTRLTRRLAMLTLLLSADLAAQQNNIAERMREDVSGLTAFSAESAKVKRNPDARCMNAQPFEFLACGPNTTISLGMMPGMWGSFEYATTQGGAAGQFLNAISGMAESTTPGTLDDLAKKANKQSGNFVTLVIPLIDYGFTGVFSNAAISINRAGSEGGVYQAVGPADALPGAEIGFPLSGTVVIEEYTPVVLRGSFSGDMVDTSAAASLGDDPQLPVVTSLSGEFNVVAPWRGDSRAVVRASEDVESAARQDIRTAFRTESTEPDNSSAQIPEFNIPGVSNEASVAKSCDCSCNLAASATPLCQKQCSGTFLACSGEPYQGPSAEQQEARQRLKDNSEDAGQRIREDFIRLLEGQYGQQANYQQTLQSMLETFDSMSSLNDKAMLYTTHGGKKLCPPPEPLKDALQMYALMFCQ